MPKYRMKLSKDKENTRTYKNPNYNKVQQFSEQNQKKTNTQKLHKFEHNCLHPC